MSNKNFMTRDKEFKEETLNEIKSNFEPINFNQQYQQPINMIQQYNVNELMMSQQFTQPTISLTITEDGMLDNKIIRENMLNKTNILDKVKGLFLLSKLEYCNMKMVADYFEIDIKTLEKCIERNKTELIENGLIKKTGKEIKEMLNNVTDNMSVMLKSSQSGFTYDNEFFRNSTNFLLNRRVILNIAMLLRDSIIVKQIRKELLNISELDYIQSYITDPKNPLIFDRTVDSVFNQVSIATLSLASVMYKNNLITEQDYNLICNNLKLNK